MKFLTAASAALLALCALSFESVNAHSWLVRPVGRDKGPRTDVDNSMGCPSSAKGQVTSFKAGEKIDVAYWRNNHLGGFIRWSIVASGQETKANFDKNAFFYTCRESGATCLPKGQNQRFSGDNSGDNTISCGDTITLPDWLPAGDYTIQWMWFGVGSSYGNMGWAEPQFKSCADIKLTTSGAKTKAPSCPTFVGGDRVTKLENKGNDQCFYFHSTAIASSQFKGDNSKAAADYKFGIPADVEKCGGGGAADGSDVGTDATAAGNADTTTRPSPAPASKTKSPSPSKKCIRRVRHGYLTLPVGRVQAIWGDTKGNQNCRVHDKGNVTEFEAGEVIQVRHTRNNHVGGFIRYSISPFGNETTADFDENAFYYTCREAGEECKPKNGNTTRYAADAAAAYVVQCGDTIKLPDWLPAGDYVLQWTWFGVGVSYGKLGLSEPQFRSCADIRLTTSGEKLKPACPTFVGGDRVTKQEGKGDDVCLYFHANDITSAIFEAEDYTKEYKFGIPAPVESCRATIAASNETDEDEDEDDVAGEGEVTPKQTPASSPSTTAPVPTPSTAPVSTPATAAPSSTTTPTQPSTTPRPKKKDCSALA